MSSDESSIGGESILSLSDDAFSPVDVPVHPFKPPTPPPPAPVNNPADEASSAPASDPIADNWKDEYDARLAHWRSESADARAKAESSRAKWEELRAAGHVPEHETWETVGPSIGTESDAASTSTGTVVSGHDTSIGPEAHGSVADQVNAPPVTSVADARDLVSGEKDGGNGAEVLGNTLGYPPSAASIRTLETSDVDASPVNLSGAELSANEAGNAWEEVHSIGSSFPSLPEQHNANAIPLQPTYRPRQAAHKKEKEHRHHSHRHSHHPPAPAPPPSLTLSVFDSSLPTRTRVIALFSSLAINMFLPFVNGVMLGFGEIFAKNVVGPWFGWPKPVATSVGVRVGKDKKRS